MLIENESRFLVLHSGLGGSGRRLEIVSAFAEALGRWTPGTRLSPIWPVSGHRLALSDDFAQRQTLVFLGPVQPAQIPDHFVALRTPGAAELWLTAGCFNVIVRCPSQADGAAPLADEITAWAKAKAIPHETWTVDAGHVVAADWWTHDPSRAQSHLSALAATPLDAQESLLQPALQEFLAVQASTLTRSAAMAPDLFADFVVIGETVTKFLEAHSAGALQTLDLNASLLSLNAAISRASSQAFSGMPPIESTECHFWIHSLLGTGAANIALARLSRWIQGILGEERIPERLRALDQVRTQVPDPDALEADPALFDDDFLHAGGLAGAGSEPVLPLITYFSGRDGFSSHLQTLSAPVSTLSECNSFRSSLLTVTHEISHILIDGVLGVIYPDHTLDGVTEELTRMTVRDYRPATLLQAARKLMFEALISLEQNACGEEMGVDDIIAGIADILKHGQAETREILVHAFDFMYFYASDPEFYIESIWHSWSAIPGIADRIPGYVLRSLCAISANLLKDGAETRLPAAIRDLRKSFARLKGDDTLLSDYVDRAVAYLDEAEADSDKMRRLRQEYAARLKLVRLVRLFLYSDTLAAKLYDDPYTRARDGRSGGKKSLQYDSAPVGNPITFLRSTLKANPTNAESIWVLHSLAFDVREAPLGSGHAGT